VIVLDASAVVEILLKTAVGAALVSRLFTPFRVLHAPHLMDLEVSQVLRRLVARRELQPERARQALSVLLDFPLQRYSHSPLIPRVWALRENLTAYDAAYVALAEVLGATLLTRDSRILRAAGHVVRVELV
jgi:predicted nucleic acid-binding protein